MMDSLPLIEKYRPSRFEDVIDSGHIPVIKTLISDVSSMPSLLFYGSPGVGKTTIAKIIIKELSPIDVKRINGSDKTGVGTIRDVVYNFMSSMSSIPGKPKIIWIEEFDHLSEEAYAALRSMQEQYIKNARFICTCNYIENVPDAIQSRFTKFEFEKPSSDSILKRLREICLIEKITISDKALASIITKSQRDVRACINYLQKLSSTSDKTIKDEDVDKLISATESFYSMIIRKDWSGLRYASEKPLQFETVLIELDEMFFKTDIPVEMKAEINNVISRGLFEMRFSFSKSICFSATCYNIMRCL